MSENHELRILASGVDSAIAWLAEIVDAYLAEAELIDQDYRARHNGAEHPSLGRRHTLVRSAVASRLARVLDMPPVNPPITLEGTVHPDELAPVPQL